MTTRIKSLSIKNFRGFYEAQLIEFAIPNGDNGSGLTIIVGPNNSGKTTVLEALKRFYKGDPPQFDIEERHNGSDVEIGITNLEGNKKVLKTMGSAVGQLENGTVYPNADNMYFISSRRYWNTYFNTSKIEHSAHKRQLLSIDKSGIDPNFGQRLISIETSSSKKDDFNSIFKEIIPNFSNWSIELSRGQNYIKYTTGKKDVHSSEFWGDGIISLFEITAGLVEGVESEILIIDEPELSLHPQAQKRLIKVLSENGKNKQIIISTHSPYFVRWEDIENGAKIIRVNKIADKSCTVNNLEESTIKDLLTLANNYLKPYLLDTVAKELFFSEKIVFVEGQEDMGIISNFIKKEGINIKFEIFGYGVGGAGNIKKFLSMAKDLNLKAGAIFDNNKKTEREDCEKTFPHFFIRTISTSDIRDKNDEKTGTSILGMADKCGEIKEEYKEELKCILTELNEKFENGT